MPTYSNVELYKPTRINQYLQMYSFTINIACLVFQCYSLYKVQNLQLPKTQVF